MTRSPHDPHAGAGGATPDLEIGATVLVESGLVFAEPDGYRPLELDLYVPEDLETPAPLLDDFWRVMNDLVRSSSRRNSLVL